MFVMVQIFLSEYKHESKAFNSDLRSARFPSSANHNAAFPLHIVYSPYPPLMRFVSPAEPPMEGICLQTDWRKELQNLRFPLSEKFKLIFLYVRD